MDVAIAVSKKCCFLCWSLHQKLNGRGEIKFSLPGTHNCIYAWIPPLEVPEEILVEIRDELLVAIQDAVSGHSRQSSGSSSDSEGLVSVPGETRKEAYTNFVNN